MSEYFVHPTAVVDEPCEIGAGTKIWHFSHVMANSRIGRNCVLGQNVFVGRGAIIGDGAKIQNNVSVFEGVELEEMVFIGPSVVFTNVLNPRGHIERKQQFAHTLVGLGATVGANATVLAGTRLGRYSFVGAGAVVVNDVPEFSLVVGVPAAPIGWVCACGVRLPLSVDLTNGVRVACHECGQGYEVTTGLLREIGRIA
jgi:UDP-2-acetamido-3-amino-2,3-dideoxy-glucuronate N-acetyltransferase